MRERERPSSKLYEGSEETKLALHNNAHNDERDRDNVIRLTRTEEFIRLTKIEKFYRTDRDREML
jgi:hypothetical protein